MVTVSYECRASSQNAPTPKCPAAVVGAPPLSSWKVPWPGRRTKGARRSPTKPKRLPLLLAAALDDQRSARVREGRWATRRRRSAQRRRQETGEIQRDVARSVE